MSRYYNNYQSYLGSQRCCNLQRQTIQGPTGPPGTPAIGPIGNTGPTGQTGPAGYLSNINTTTITLNTLPNSTILDSSNNFIASWICQITTDTNVYFSFENFVVNGYYNLYIFNNSLSNSSFTIVNLGTTSIYNNFSSTITILPNKYAVLNILLYSDGTSNYYFINSLGIFS